MAEFRGVLHVHSTFSDGALSLEEVGDWALREGLDFVCLADHSGAVRGERLRQLCDNCRSLSGQVLLVPGVEFEYRGRHVVVIAPAEALLGLTDRDVIENPVVVRRAGGMTIWAHPSLTFSVSLRDAIATEYDGWEVWNRRADGRTPCVPILRLFRRLARNRPLLPHAGVDLHALPVRNIPVYTLQTADAQITTEALVDALRSGEYAISDSGEAARIAPQGPDASAGTYASVASWLRYLAIRGRCVAAVLKHRVVCLSFERRSGDDCG
jgi:hypothetical protein